MEVFFAIIILIISVVIHEVSHGYAADAQGDPTARLAGRLTLNPVPHIDILGSIVIPGLLLLTGSGFVIGWAKPVPFNPYNLRNQRWGEALVAAAGPASNILLAVIFGLLIRFSDFLSLPESFVALSAYVVLINLVLAVFNLMPFPPLDGSKIFFSFLPARFQYIRGIFEKNWLLVFIIFVLVIWQILFPVIIFLFKILTGITNIGL
ncbi:MAG: site-2 protease family protein [Parcubacteria group bacterium CG11_big_fil_rev_8_21_14_0_20_39_22]|nr:MAG: site-2 protease family protein [Parcubacteria group bacterium CG11_big_fil_rev_8_21_14_0_20_39_22]